MSTATRAIQALIDAPKVSYPSGPRPGLRAALAAVQDAELVDWEDRRAASAPADTTYVVPDVATHVSVPYDAIVVPRPRVEPVEYVGVAYTLFDSPSESARYGQVLGPAPPHYTLPSGRPTGVWVYSVPESWNVTIGDTVELPEGDIGTVVTLNESDPTLRCGYCKQLVGIV